MAHRNRGCWSRGADEHCHLATGSVVNRVWKYSRIGGMRSFFQQRTEEAFHALHRTHACSEDDADTLPILIGELDTGVVQGHFRCADGEDAETVHAPPIASVDVRRRVEINAPYPRA